MSDKYNKSIASLQTVRHETVSLDAQKILIKTPKDSLTERTDILEYFNDTLDEKMEPVKELNNFILSSEDGTYSTNIYNGNTENTNVVGFQYSREHFIFDKEIKSISLPHYDPGQWILPFNAPTGYLSARIFTNGEEPKAVVYSDNSVTLNGSKEAVFNFTDFKLPYQFTYIQFAIVPNKTTIPTLPQGAGCLAFIAKVISDTASGDLHADDLCLGYYNNASHKWVVDMRVNYTEYSGVAHDIDLLQETSDKNLLKTENLRGQLNDLTNKVDEDIANVNSRIDEVNENITIDNVLKNFSNVNVITNTTDGTCIQLSREHFVEPNVKISNVILPYKDQASNLPSNPQYLHLQFFKNDSSTPLCQYDSPTPQSRAAGTTGESDWLFDNVVVPEYDYVHITLSGSPTDKNINGPNAANCSSFRINVVTLEGNETQFDNDGICKVWRNRSAQPYMGEVKVVYYGTNTLEELADRVATLENETNINSEQLSSKITELEENAVLFNNNLSTTNTNLSNLTTEVNNFKEATESANTEVTEELTNIKNDLSIALESSGTNVSFCTSTHKHINKTTGGTQNATVQGFRIKAPHFTSGKINVLRVFKGNATSESEIYLYLIVNGKQYCSVNPVQLTADKQWADFEFENVYIPETYNHVDLVAGYRNDLSGVSFDYVADGALITATVFNEGEGNIYSGCLMLGTSGNGFYSKWIPKIYIFKEGNILHEIANDCDIVIEAASGDNWWYRLYKNGWLEQGGWKTGFTAAGKLTCSFKKSYASNTYFPSISPCISNNSTVTPVGIDYSTLASNKFECYCVQGGTDNYSFYWETRGMADMSEYLYTPSEGEN